MKPKYPDIEALKKDIGETFKRILDDKSLVRPCFTDSNSQPVDIDRDFTKAFMKENPPKTVIVSKRGGKRVNNEVRIFGTDVFFKDVIDLGAIPMKVLDELGRKKTAFQNGNFRIEKRFAIHSVPYIVAIPCKQALK